MKTTNLSDNEAPIVKYEHIQFTAFDQYLNPDIAFDKDFVDFEEISTGLSMAIIVYGYRKLTHHKKGNGWDYEWITRKEYKEAVNGKNNN